MPDRWKRAAAEAAVALVEDGMTLGLGTGSTAAAALRPWPAACAPASGSPAACRPRTARPSKRAASASRSPLDARARSSTSRSTAPTRSSGPASPHQGRRRGPPAREDRGRRQRRSDDRRRRHQAGRRASARFPLPVEDTVRPAGRSRPAASVPGCSRRAAPRRRRQALPTDSAHFSSTAPSAASTTRRPGADHPPDHRRGRLRPLHRPRHRGDRRRPWRNAGASPELRPVAEPLPAAATSQESRPLAPTLFTPVDLGPVRLPNRIVVSPMCQYSADDGCADRLAPQSPRPARYSGAGLVVDRGDRRRARSAASRTATSASTATPTRRPLARVLASAAARMPAPARHPARPRRPQGLDRARPGKAAARSAPARTPGGRRPLRRSLRRRRHTPRRWTRPASRAVATPSSRRPPRRPARPRRDRAPRRARLPAARVLLAARQPRTDRYGGSLDNRIASRSSIPRPCAPRSPRPRASACGSPARTGPRTAGRSRTPRHSRPRPRTRAAATCASRAAASPPHVRVPVGPGYQVPLAARVREETGIRDLGGRHDRHARAGRSVVAEGKADLVAIARGFLDDPRWGWHAAGAWVRRSTSRPSTPRSGAKVWPGAKLARPVEGVTR